MVKNRDKLLILDLDETLIHATETPLVQRSDFLVYTYHIYQRPHLDTFLATCLDWFDVAVWTSSGSEYAAEVVNTIFPDPQALAFVWASDRCSIVYNYNYDLIDGDYPQYYSRKPLKKVKRQGYNLESVITIDDTLAYHQKSGRADLCAAIRFSTNYFSNRRLCYLSCYLNRQQMPSDTLLKRLR